MTLIVYSALVFFWRPQWRRLDTMCEMFQMGANTLCWHWGRFFLWDLSGVNRPTVFFIVYILCICNFLYFVTILYAFCRNYSRPNYKLVCAEIGEVKIIFINRNWVFTRWQRLIYMYTIAAKFTSGGPNGKHIVATWNRGKHLSICF
jgi:hypothetical protein